MRSFFREEPLTLAEATRIIPGRPHKNTLRRWCHSGVRGVKLGHFYSGATLCTTRRAIEDFWAALNPQAPARSSDGHAKAEAQLDAMGV